MRNTITFWLLFVTLPVAHAKELTFNSLVSMFMSGLAQGIPLVILILLIVHLDFVYLFRDPEDINFDSDNKTDLMKAAVEGDLDKINFLVSLGEDVNAQDSQGATALIFAAVKGHEAAVDLLLTHGAKKSLRPNSGFPPYKYPGVYDTPSHERITKKLKYKWKNN
jgi:hypothetical protein